MDWLAADARTAEATQSVFVTLMKGWIDETDPWLKQLTDYRNLFLHRGPIGARGMDSAPRLATHATRYGEVRTLVLPIPRKLEGPETVDALVQFVRLYWQMCHLAADLALLSPYSRTTQVVTRADMVEDDAQA